ncbi:MAG: POTRA domain-containing protein [Candidatus Krumholzibacteriia bacterium]
MTAKTIRHAVLTAVAVTMAVTVAATATAAAAPAPAPDPDAAPTLRFGHVRIVTRPIFSTQEVTTAQGPVRLMRRLMNGLHTDTRERVIRRELLFVRGQRYEPGLLEETARNLRTLGFLNDVDVVAVDTTAQGTVDVLVTTRESWTLSTSVGYSLASGGEQRWNLKLAESNFLGYGVTVGAGAGADEDRSWWNVWYRKRRLFGRALWFGADWSETGDGHARQLFLSRPLFALDDARGLDAVVWDKESRPRWYLSHAGPAGLDPAATGSLYARLPWRERGAELQGVWRATRRGAPRIWRVGGGVRVTDTDRQVGAIDELADGRGADLGWLAVAGGPLTRETGVRVFPFAWLQTVGRRWTEARFVLQYGPVEDVPLDGSLDLKVGPAGGAVGSTAADGAGALRVEGAAQQWLQVGRSFGLLRLEGQAQAGPDAVRTHRVQALGAWLAQAGGADAPWLTRLFVEAAHGSALAGDQALVLGLDRGLRTLEFDGMAGDRLLRWNLEQGKVTPWEVLGLARLGAAVSYAGGCAWWRDETRGLADARHEAGFGLRLGPTRSANTQVTRIDVTWSLDGTEGPVLTAVTRGLF